MRNTFLFTICGALLATGCSDKLGKLDEPALAVTVKKNTFRVGDPIVFEFAGKQDNISFYSGEVYNDYAFRNGREADLAGKGGTLDFFSQLSGTGTQSGQVSIRVSTDYNGKGDYASVKAATWADITAGFTLATGATNIASGKVDVSDRLSADKPLYIAFRYLTKPQKTNGLARIWWIQSLALRSKADPVGGKELLVADQETAGFRTVDQFPADAPSQSTISATRVTLLGNKYKNPEDSIFNPAYSLYDPKNPIYDPKSPQYQPAARIPVYVPYDPNSPYNDPETETWVISKPILAAKANLGPDKAISLKGINTDAADSYTYAYKTPGKYVAVFIATNHNTEGIKTVVREVELTIEP